MTVMFAVGVGSLAWMGALAALMVLFEYRRRAPALVPAESRAAQRKAEWSARRERL